MMSQPDHSSARWYDSIFPDVSIIILNFNAADLTKQCLDAIWMYTFDYRYEILVIDNGSKSDEAETLGRVDGYFRLIRLPENRHFSEGCNTGAREAKGRYLVFINNDAFVTDGWLSPLINGISNYPNAGAVGPRIEHPDGRLQEAGAYITETGSSIRIGDFEPYHVNEASEVRIVDYCSAACFLISKDLFDDLGGFDSLFSPAYYEDVDLCFRMRANGKYVYYCPDSTVVHLQNATSLQVWTKSELTEVIEVNRNRFLARWGNWLKNRAGGG
jgi:GT2 family glycosyltransferase